MIPLVLQAVLVSLPTAHELDFGPLLAEPKGVYDYTIVLSFPGEPDVRIPITTQREDGPVGSATFFAEGLSDPSWKFAQNGQYVTLHGYDDVRTANIIVEGKGLKPQVRRVIAFPPAPKKK